MVKCTLPFCSLTFLLESFCKHFTGALFLVRHQNNEMRPRLISGNAKNLGMVHKDAAFQV